MKTLITVCTIVLGCLTAQLSRAEAPKPQVIEIQVTEKGFEPSSIDAKVGSSVTLKITRKTESTCATAVQVPSKKIKKDLPLNQTVNLDLGTLQGGKLDFACGMNMLHGQITVKK